MHPVKLAIAQLAPQQPVDPELAVVLEGKKSAPQVPIEWIQKSDSPTETHELCLLI